MHDTAADDNNPIFVRGSGRGVGVVMVIGYGIGVEGLIGDVAVREVRRVWAGVGAGVGRLVRLVDVMVEREISWLAGVIIWCGGFV